MSDLAAPDRSEAAQPHSRTENLGRGIALILLSSLFFSVMNAGIKWLSNHLSPIEIGFFRQTFSLIPIGVLIAHQGGFAVLRTRRPFGHAFRGTIGNLAMIVFILSVARLPLADATALSFASPFFVTALSVPLLGEAVGLHRWSAVVVGFIGVLVMTHPTGAMFAQGAGIGVGMGLLASFFSALMMITIRQLSRTERPVTTVFYFAMFGCVIFGALLPFYWVPPTLADWGVLLMIGLVGGVSQFVMTDAYRHAPAALLAPFGYTTLLWSTILGYLIWDQLPGPRVIVGAAIVIASGLYIIYREVRRRAKVESRPIAAAS